MRIFKSVNFVVVIFCYLTIFWEKTCLSGVKCVLSAKVVQICEIKKFDKTNSLHA